MSRVVRAPVILGVEPKSAAPVVERIAGFNRDRDPDRLALKYRAMAKHPFSFFRGTAHLFWEDWAADPALDQAPWAWSCGDLHFENFGAYKAANRLEYFDLNDFDETALAPCMRDPTRGACSIILAAATSHCPAREQRLLAEAFIDAYARTLQEGRVSWIERETATGDIWRLLCGLRRRTRAQFLGARTKLRKGRRTLRFSKYGLRAKGVERARAIRIVRAAAEADERRFFRVLDVTRRIAGTGSLGVERYAVLVEGKGSPDGNVLLDLKAACPSTLAPRVAVPQPEWESEAQRVVWAQRNLQAVPPAFLREVRLEGRSYVLKELQPRDDRLTWKRAERSLEHLEATVGCMGQLLAWAQLRAAGRHGAANPDALMSFASGSSWRKLLLRYATAYAVQVRRDHQAFRRAWARGALAAGTPSTKRPNIRVANAR